ncbi:MAG: phosphoribosyl-AMP cyclohydrolase [Pseudomonadota bacterium]
MTQRDHETPEGGTGADTAGIHDRAPGWEPVALPEAVRWDDRGLLPAIAQDHASGEVLMVAWMNAASLAETLETGWVTYWSRSRQARWRKGETSGHVQRLVAARIDCDRDCVLLLVDQAGPACHTHRRSCFYTALEAAGERETMAPMA